MGAITIYDSFIDSTPFLDLLILLRIPQDAFKYEKYYFLSKIQYSIVNFDFHTGR